MNDRIVVPLAILTSIVSLSVGLPATAIAQSAPTGAALPDNAAQVKARAALYADQAPAAAPAQSTPEQSGTEARQAAAPVEEAAASAAVVEEPGSQPDNEAQAKARAALRAEEAAPVAVAAIVATEPAQNPAETATAAAPVSAEIAAPALPTSQSQQEQLAALLQQYRNDAISASDYHSRRAEILAGK